MIVVRHFQTGTLEPALDIEALIRLRAVKDGLYIESSAQMPDQCRTPHKAQTAWRAANTYLVAPDLLSDIIQRLNDPQTQLLPLLSLLDRNVLDVAHQTQRVDELALHDQAPRAHDAARAVADDEQVVLVVACSHPVVALVPLVRGDVADGGEYAQHVQVAIVVIGAAERTNTVALREGGDDGGRDKGGREERLLIGSGGGGGHGGGAEAVLRGGRGGGCCHCRVRHLGNRKGCYSCGFI